MAGLIYGMMGGLGEGMQKTAEHVSKSALQRQSEEALRLRDERLAEARRGEMQFAEELRRAPAKAAAVEIEQARTGTVDDLSGTTRPRTPSELAESSSQAFLKQGMVAESGGVLDREMRREEMGQRTLDRTADNNRADRQLAETGRHYAATEKLQGAQLAQAKALAEANRPLQQDKDGQYFFRNMKGEAEFLKGPDGQQIKGPKDASASDQIRAKAIMAQIEAVSRDIGMEAKEKQAAIAALVSALPGSADKDQSGSGGPATPHTQAEMDALPAGTLFINPSDGKTYRKKGAPAQDAQPADGLDVAPVGFDQPPPATPDPKSRGMLERERVLGVKSKREKDAYAKKYLGNI